MVLALFTSSITFPNPFVFIFNFFTPYIFIIFSSLQDNFPSLPTWLIVLSKKITKTNKLKTWSPLCVGQTTPEHEAWPKLWFICQGSYHWRKLVFLSQKASVQIAFWLWVGLCAQFSFSMLVICLAWLCICMCCHSLCEFICALVILCLKDTLSLELSTTSGS